MNAGRRWIPILVLSGLLLLSAGVLPALGQTLPASASDGASASYRLDWAAAGEVNGGESASTQYRLSATIGRLGAGTRSGSTHYTLCVGFYCAAPGAYRVFLPLIWK